MLGKLSNLCGEKIYESGLRRRSNVRKEVTNLDTLLEDIYLEYISIKDEDFRLYYRVVEEVFAQMHRAMKKTNRYYRKYSSRVQYAGSHADNLRISKPDEFDIDITIGMPLSIKKNALDPAESDLILEPEHPGFVKLKMGVQYKRLSKRCKHDWQENCAASNWGNKKLYLQRTKFMDWFKGVVDKALNEFRYDGHPLPLFVVDDDVYSVRKSESGPAVTLFIEDKHGFKLDVDLVPALRFPVDRWPICSKNRPIPSWWCYPKRKRVRRSNQPRCRPQNSADHFMVVPKPSDKNNPVPWRIAMQDQERMLMHNTNNMRQAIRYMKKFRDAQNMDSIASYYIKTMFFWEAMDHYKDRDFWDNSPAFLFQHMLKKLWKILDDGKLPHFWDRRDDLLKNIPRSILKGYANKVDKLLEVLDQPSEYRRVAEFMLTEDEYREYSKYL